MKPNQNNLVMCFVCQGSPARKLCTVNHPPETQCKRPHEVPADALWSGEWMADEIGDLISDVKHHRKMNRNALRRWQTKHNRLLKKKAAPAFTEYRNEIIEKHLREKPKFDFKPRRAV